MHFFFQIKEVGSSNQLNITPNLYIRSLDLSVYLSHFLSISIFSDHKGYLKDSRNDSKTFDTVLQRNF